MVLVLHMCPRCKLGSPVLVLVLRAITFAKKFGSTKRNLAFHIGHVNLNVTRQMMSFFYPTFQAPYAFYVGRRSHKIPNSRKEILFGWKHLTSKHTKTSDILRLKLSKDIDFHIPYILSNIWSGQLHDFVHYCSHVHHCNLFRNCLNLEIYWCLLNIIKNQWHLYLYDLRYSWILYIRMPK